MITGNKGEWSEIYTFLKLLADGRLYAADSDLNRIENIYYPILKILRTETDGSREYCRNGNIKVINSDDGQILVSLPINTFVEYSKKLYNIIIDSNGKRTFPAPEIEEFLSSINCTTIKAQANEKSDITLVVHDQFTGFDPILGFSIKSRIGGASTLLNPGTTTNFIYKIRKKSFTNLEIEYINSINPLQRKYKDRITYILSNGGKFKFTGMENEIFKLNLQVIDSNMPIIVSNMLLNYYMGNASSLIDLLDIVEKENPCNFNLGYNHTFYEYKIKSLLTDIALGMTPATVWKGHYDATGGYIVVKEDGEILCYHIYNRNEFEDYLLKNTKLDTPSHRYNFGELYKEKNDVYMKLNLQIRFKK